MGTSKKARRDCLKSGSTGTLVCALVLVCACVVCACLCMSAEPRRRVVLAVFGSSVRGGACLTVPMVLLNPTSLPVPPKTHVFHPTLAALWPLLGGGVY